MLVLLPGICFVFAVVIHGLSSRVSVHLDSVRRFLLIGTPIGIVLAILAVTLYGVTVPGLAALALYAFLCELYIFGFTLAISSISATTLVMLRDGPLQLADLTAIYKPNKMVELRVGRLLQTGLLDTESGHLVLTRRGCRLHAAFSTLSQFFGHSAR
jgi:hypothetical protein